MIALGEFEKSDAYAESEKYWRKRIETLPVFPPSLPLAKQPSAVQKPYFSRLHATLGAGVWYV